MLPYPYDMIFIIYHSNVLQGHLYEPSFSLELRDKGDFCCIKYYKPEKNQISIKSNIH